MGLRPGLAIGLLWGLLVPALAAQGHSAMAPADEYFGPTKMSPLEITNRIHDAQRRGASYGGLMSTQGAIEDWTRKYPGDPWIPPREYEMSHLFAGLHSHAGNAEAAHCRYFEREHFPGTRYAVAAQRESGTRVARASTRSSARHATRTHTSKKAAAKKSPAKKRKKFLGIF
jgi:hypothetical protein